jgi:RHS repeat-associated core domain
LQAHSVSQQDRNLFQRRYAYDANGNLAGIDDSRKGNRSYHYDPLDRLINVRGTTPESFAHDPAGNLLGQGDQPTTNLANVKGNRLLMQGDRHYDYDAYGNQIRERRGTGQKLVTEYRYDCQHRLIGVSLPGGSVASYKYDAFGRRIAKTVDGQTTEFLWQGERLIAESASNRYRSYIYEPGTFRPLAMLDGEGPLKAEPFYYQLDHLGTPQELTDYSGEIMWSAKYRAYGNLATLDIAEIDNPLRFQGQYFDTETGLHYNRHRYYNPCTGRFLTPDPIKLAGGLNNYQYVPNPTGWVDPLGLSCVPSNCPDDRRAELNQKYGRTGDINNDINARGRKETATEFYRTQGFEETSIPGHLNGIDFNQPVNVETLNRGKTVYQFQSPGAPQGNYYSLNPATTPSELGIGPLGDNRAAGTVELKLQGIYRTTEKTRVLKSTAKPIDDTWSVKGITQPSSGGGTQVFSSAKGNFEKTQ